MRRSPYLTDHARYRPPPGPGYYGRASRILAEAERLREEGRRRRERREASSARRGREDAQVEAYAARAALRDAEEAVERARTRLALTEARLAGLVGAEGT